MDKSNVFTVLPMAQSISLKAGQVYEGSITVVNPSDATADFPYQANVTPYGVSNEGYEADLVTDSDRTAISKWIEIEEPTGVTVSGTISGVSAADSVTVELYKDGQAAAVQTATVTGNGTYSFDSVEAGTYTIKATCDGYEAYSATITVADSAVTHDIAIIKEASTGLKGDINGDGQRTAADAQEILRYAAALDSLITDAEIASWLKIADINGDGQLTAADAQEILRFAASLESALDA